MTRWHNSACTEPQVVLADNWPSCTACGHSCPPLETLRAGQPSAISGVPELPPDEPPGELNLWWPLSVPYVNPDGSRPQRPTARQRRLSGSGYTEPSPMYDRTLSDGEFRLICLSAVEDSDYPLHVTLETYSDDCHPEYEAASYLWGGEDGDYSLQKPVFIGPYWDVALLTKNCWSMLRFARPWRGVRMLFVDAVCINQQEMQEREIQVAKMGSIYASSTRVMVYLGEDIVTATRRFAPCRPLHELGYETLGNSFPKDHSLAREPFGLQQLFQRKYFSRVWMIQELVLSERAIFRIGDIDYRADAHIMAQTMSKFEELMATNPFARWISCVGNGSNALGDKPQLLSVIQLTQHSHASDPRDHLYGVLPVAGGYARPLIPDYSISSRHFMIGIFAHLLLKDKQWGILTLPRERRGNHQVSKPRLPSWLPDAALTSSSWHYILRNVDNRPGESADHNSRMRNPWSMDFDEIAGLLVGLRRTKLEQTKLEHRVLTSVYYHFHTGAGYHPRWYRGARVCSTSGALTIKLMCLFALSDRPKFQWAYRSVPDIKRVKIYSLTAEENGPSQFHHLYLASHARLGQLVWPGQDYLFVLLPDRDAEYTYLILRRQPGAPEHTSEYTLVTSDVYIFHAHSIIHGETILDPPGDGGVLVNSVAQMIAKVRTSHEIVAFLHLEASGTRVWSTLRKMLPGQLTTDWRTVGTPVDVEPIYFRFKPTEDPDGKWDLYIELNHDRESKFGGETRSWKLEGDEQDALFQVLLLHKENEYGLKTWDVEWTGKFDGDLEWRKRTWHVDRDEHGWYARIILGDVSLCQRRGSSWTREQHTWYSEFLKSRDEEADRHAHQDILLRPLPNLMKRILNEIKSNLALMRGIRDAYDPPLTWETVLNMIRVGPTAEQRYIRERKTFGALELDGRIMDVTIV